MTRFIAEISSNHNGDLNRCFELIRQAALCGCWGVKFQLFRMEQLFSREILETSETHRQRRRWELPLHYIPELAACAKAEGITFGCTPFDLEAVDLLAPHVDFLKIASYELTWVPLIHQCGQTGLPLMISTGMADQNEIMQAIAEAKTSGVQDLAVFHCVSNYPTLVKDCNLAAIKTLGQLLANDFPQGKVGWSDHSVNPGVIRRAVDFWASDLVEFHFDLDGEGHEYSAGHCWLPGEISPVIAGSEFEVSNICDGQGNLCPAPSEQEERLWRADPTDGWRPYLEMRKPWHTEHGPDANQPLILFIAGGPGMGHAARLLSIAEQLRHKTSWRILFIIKKSEACIQMLNRHGLAWKPGPLPTEELVSFGSSVAVIDQKEPCTALIDAFKISGTKTLVLDRPDCRTADQVIIPAFGWKGNSSNNQRLEGPDYLLIREDVLTRSLSKPRAFEGRLVISFGGEDPNLLTEKIARALENISQTFKVQFVIGPDFPKHRHRWPDPVFDRPNYQLIETGDPLESIIPGADLLITAMGITIFEAHVLGVPVAVLFNYATDTSEVGLLAAEKLVCNLGLFSDVSDQKLASSLNELLNNSSLRKQLATHALSHFDGLGARRVSDLIVQLLKESDGKNLTC